MSYATYEDVQKGFHALDTDEIEICEALLEEVAIIIDHYNSNASTDIKKLVSCRVVRRELSNRGDSMVVPSGASQGSVSAMGYSQSWTLSGGSTGELYLTKLDKNLLGVGNAIGSYSPVESLVEND